MNTKEFIEKARFAHGDKYDYSLVEYTGSFNKVVIICPTHGKFEQIASNHINNKCGCNYCSSKLFIKSFEERANNIHGDKYSYNKSKYKNMSSKVIITCPIHGDFLQTPIQHITMGRGCKECGRKNTNLKLINHNFFIKARLIHGNKYDYSQSIYINAYTKIKIICFKHGIFKQTPHKHLNAKQGCPSCNESHGEKIIAQWLNESGIEYKRQKRFLDCKYKNALPFDFYLSDYNICIEYDGIQHFEERQLFGGKEEFELVKLKDGIKTQYCLDKGMKLLRISYSDNIKEELIKHIYIKIHNGEI